MRPHAHLILPLQIVLGGGTVVLRWVPRQNPANVRHRGSVVLLRELLVRGHIGGVWRRQVNQLLLLSLCEAIPKAQGSTEPIMDTGLLL